MVENGIVDGAQADSDLANDIVDSEKESQRAIDESAISPQSKVLTMATDFEEVNLDAPSLSPEASSQPVVDGAHAANFAADSSLANATTYSAKESQHAIEQSALSHQTKVSAMPTNCEKVNLGHSSLTCEASSQHVAFSTRSTDNSQ